MTERRPVVLLLLPLLQLSLLLAAAPAGAADAVPAGARLAATCTGCHGTNGATLGGAVPSLAGQPKQALLASLKAFKSGERPATVMTQLAKGYTDPQLEQLAEFFSAPQPSGGGS
jgi:sulfide dehydrogenase cytochrome subunit